MTPCQTVETRSTARRIESMQQSSATPKKSRCREGVAEDCCMLSILLAVLLVSTVFGTVSSLHPIYFIFNDFYTCMHVPSLRLLSSILAQFG